MYRDLLVNELLNGDSWEGSSWLFSTGIWHNGPIYWYFDGSFIGNSQHYACPVVITGAVGRPAFQIPRDQLQYLIENRFSVPQIAQVLSRSVSTVRRQMSCYNLSIRSTYSMITDAQLDDLVVTVQQQFPNWGNQQTYSHLLSRGTILSSSWISKPGWSQRMHATQIKKLEKNVLRSRPSTFVAHSWTS